MPRALCRSMESRHVRGILDKWPFAKEIVDARPSFLSRLRVSTSSSYSFIESRFTARCYIPRKRASQCVFRENAHPRARRISWHTEQRYAQYSIEYLMLSKEERRNGIFHRFERKLFYERIKISKKKQKKTSVLFPNGSEIINLVRLTGQFCRVTCRESRFNMSQ